MIEMVQPLSGITSTSRVPDLKWDLDQPCSARQQGKGALMIRLMFLKDRYVHIFLSDPGIPGPIFVSGCQ